MTNRLEHIRVICSGMGNAATGRHDAGVRPGGLLAMASNQRPELREKNE